MTDLTGGVRASAGLGGLITTWQDRFRPKTPEERAIARYKKLKAAGETPTAQLQGTQGGTEIVTAPEHPGGEWRVYNPHKKDGRRVDFTKIQKVGTPRDFAQGY